MNRIKEIRTNLKMTQSELSKAVGITRQTVSLYEKGQREPKGTTWQKLAQVLGVSVLYLQGLSDTKLNLVELSWSGKTSAELADAVNKIESIKSARLSVFEYVEQLNMTVMQRVLTLTELVDNRIVDEDLQNALLDPFDKVNGQLEKLEIEYSTDK